MTPQEQVIRDYRQHSETELDWLKRENAELRISNHYLQLTAKLFEDVQPIHKSICEENKVLKDWLLRLGDRIVIMAEILGSRAERKDNG